MSRVRRHFRGFIGLALLAMLQFALAPAAWGGPGEVGPWSAVCSAAGPAHAPSPTPGGTLLAGHCPLCAQATGPAALPAPETALPTPDMAATPWPGTGRVIACQSPSRWAPLPRAPPARG